jgi:hypothetical protein
MEQNLPNEQVTKASIDGIRYSLIAFSNLAAVGSY